MTGMRLMLFPVIDYYLSKIYNQIRREHNRKGCYVESVTNRGNQP